MIEIPESRVLARQINEVIKGKTIREVVPRRSPHKFAWYFQNPEDYQVLLTGRKIESAIGIGSMVEINASGAVILFGDGIRLTFHQTESDLPEKNQLLIEFEDHTYLSAVVLMYGGLWCFPTGRFDNPYYLGSKSKPFALDDSFNTAYFVGLIENPAVQKASAKAFLATEQRIPGLGNGVLQDILFRAGLHPKRKIGTFTPDEKSFLFEVLKTTLNEMVERGGRDTERDLFGKTGGYQTQMSKNTVGKPCLRCGETIVKEAYMGGSIYYCPHCQNP